MVEEVTKGVCLFLSPWAVLCRSHRGSGTSSFYHGRLSSVHRLHSSCIGQESFERLLGAGMLGAGNATEPNRQVPALVEFTSGGDR